MATTAPQATTAPKVDGPNFYFYGFYFGLGRSLVHERRVDWIAAGVGLRR
jgi:hypothetical protein